MRRAFTLIELLIVIIIIGILVSIAFPVMKTIKTKAICVEATDGMNAIRTALQQYYLENGSYPVGMAEIWDHPEWISSLKVRKSFSDPYGSSSLDGTYLSQECYYFWFSNSDDSLRCISCAFYGFNTMNHAPRAQEAEASTGYTGPPGPPRLFMYIKSGKITQRYFPSSGYPQDTNY